MGNAIVIMNTEVKPLAGEIYERVITRHQQEAVFHAIEPVEKTAEWVVDNTTNFEKKNPVGIQLINNILDEVTYNDQYQAIGEKSKADMDEGEWVLFMATGFGDNELTFGKQLVYLNVVGAVMQYVHGFEKVSMTVQADLVEEQTKGLESINAQIIHYIGIVVNTINEVMPEISYLETAEDEMDFAEKFQDNAISGKGKSPEDKAISTAVDKVMGSDGSSKFFAKLVSEKVRQGSIHPIEALVKHEEILSTIISELVIIATGVVYRMKKNGAEFTDELVAQVVGSMLKEEE